MVLATLGFDAFAGKVETLFLKLFKKFPSWEIKPSHGCS
jgi:hypothetical protein